MNGHRLYRGERGKEQRGSTDDADDAHCQARLPSPVTPPELAMVFVHDSPVTPPELVPVIAR